MASDDEQLSERTSQATTPVSDMLSDRIKPSSSSDILNQVVTRRCPRVNCPEKIVIALDLSQEMDAVVFKSRSGDKFHPLKIVKRAVSIFVWSKHRLDPRHQFAVVLMADLATWGQGFTSNPRDVTSFLDGVAHSFPSPGDTFDLTEIFEIALERAGDLRPVDAGMAPPFVLRFIIFYGRSRCVPELDKRDLYDMMRCLPQVFIDVFYIHELASDANNCTEIFDNLCHLDEDGLSYIFEVSRNLTKVYDYTAQLVAHPLQRPLQRDASYRIRSADT